MPDPLEPDGWRFARRAVGADQLDKLRAALRSGSPGDAASASSQRNVLAIPEVGRFAASPAMADLVEPLIGVGARAVRGILFDKAPGANWGVGWHQDQVIAVAERCESPGFTAWSTKSGVTHVKPPEAILQWMVTVRLHLDDCPAENGALQVLSGSHRHGLIDSERVAELRAAGDPVTCEARAGDALLMRPLLLHASPKAKSPGRRRVLHLEYAGESLPGGLRWPEW